MAIASLGNEALDPILGPSNNLRYLDYIYDPLVGGNYQADDLSKSTGIAKDWTITDDGRTYTFQLRPWKFHNGDDLTAEDVKFSLERLRDPKAVTTFGAHISSLIDSVTVKGPQLVEVRLKQASPTFLVGELNDINDVSSFVVSKKYFESVGPAVFASKPIGSGPYKLMDRQVGAFIKLEQAYPEHFAIGKPRFKNITMTLVPEESTRIAMLQSGQADFVDISIKQVNVLKKAGFKTFSSKALAVLQVMFQPFRPDEPTADLNLRKALSYAINREELNRTVMEGLGKVSGIILVNQFIEKANDPTPFDLAKAKEFLDKTPYGTGGKQLTLKLQLPIRDGWPQLALGEAVQGYWKKIGVNAEIIYRDYGAFRAELVAHTLAAPAAMMFNVATAARAGHAAASVWFTGKGVLSVASDPQLEKLITDWAAAPDQQVYVDRAAVAEKYITDNCYAIPILTAPNFYAGDDQIRDDFTAGYTNTAFNPRGLVWNP